MRKKIIFFLVLTIVVLLSSLFFWKQEKSYIFPLKINCCRNPLVNIQIENKSYPILVDLGYNASLSLDKEIVASIKQKTFIKKCCFQNFKGNIYERSCYAIPGVFLDKLSIRNLSCDERDLDSYWDTRIYIEKGDTKDYNGAIGRELLQRYQVLFDFPNLKMQLFPKKNPLEKRILNSKEYLKIFYVLIDEGIFIPIKTDFGDLFFLLDTGCTLTHLKATPKLEALAKRQQYGIKVIESQNFTIREKNFGPKEIHLLEGVQLNEKIDGFLGMDFLINRVMYIDFDNQCIYLK